MPRTPGDGRDDGILFVPAEGDLPLLDAEGRVIGTEAFLTAVDGYRHNGRIQDLKAGHLTPLPAREELQRETLQPDHRSVDPR